MISVIGCSNVMEVDKESLMSETKMSRGRPSSQTFSDLALPERSGQRLASAERPGKSVTLSKVGA